MNLEHLRTYLEIVKRGSFSEAARHLGMTQPGVTLQIQKLERDLGVPLLDRKEGGVGMTGAGEEFHRFAVKVLAEKLALEDRLQGLSGEISGRLALGASTVPGEYILPRLLADFIRLHPAVEASVQVGDTDTVADMLMRSECDLAFLGASVERRGFRREKFLDDELVLIVPVSHHFAGRKSVPIVELEEEKLIIREAGSGTMQSVHHLLQHAGFDSRLWQHAPVFGSTQAIVSAVEAGLGVAFVSAFAAEKSIECGRIAALGVEGVPLKRDLYITYLDKHLTTKLLQEFLSFALLWATSQEQRVAL
ncbi:MAG: LysR family transcriptional regulator [Chloroflexi bacterium]|nr:LysR family transcriptional regulator [Chloroflexota bacterium]